MDWLSDLQTAAILEPRRSLLRSYAGKAFSDTGNARLALKELAYAKELDPNDPTPWLYSALELYQQNRANESVRDLERSIERNDNRAVYRSRLLLDQDNAIRRTSLAKIYQSAGLDEVALREAARAVSYDYANHSAHQFLAESYNALRDPTRFNLRYETVWFNELLLANLLSPVGAGLLSQNISQQEYASLFEHNRLGLVTSSEYRSDRQFRQMASHYGLLGRTSYTLDLDYQHNSGTRPNNELNRIEWYTQFKHQLSPRDSIFFLTKYQDYEAGDNFQHYDPASVSRRLRVEELQAPVLAAALHREWRPGMHTTLLGGVLQARQKVHDRGAFLDVRTNLPPAVFVDEFQKLDYEADFEALTLELNQIAQAGSHTFVAGARYVNGDVEAASTVDDPNPTVASFYNLPVHTSYSTPLQRWSVYAYDTWELFPSFRITAGLTYDLLCYPANFQAPPVQPGRLQQQKLSPKAALVWEATSNVTLRGIYSRSLGGVSFDESVRLEPVQLAGFSQAFRNIISEAEVGSVAGARYEVSGLAADLKLGGNTYLGIEGQRLQSMVDHQVGAFVENGASAFSSSLQERLHYSEWSGNIGIHRLLNDVWSAGVHYRYTDSELTRRYPTIPTSLVGSPSRTEAATLHQFGLNVVFQHPSGLFARGGAEWFVQDNRGYGYSVYSGPRTEEAAYQLNLLAGYRFWRRRGELSVGCLNATAQNYRLNSLTPYHDLPRERVWLARLNLNF